MPVPSIAGAVFPVTAERETPTDSVRAERSVSAGPRSAEVAAARSVCRRMEEDGVSDGSCDNPTVSASVFDSLSDSDCGGMEAEVDFLSAADAITSPSRTKSRPCRSRRPPATTQTSTAAAAAATCGHRIRQRGRAGVSGAGVCSPSSRCSRAHPSAGGGSSASRSECRMASIQSLFRSCFISSDQCVFKYSRTLRERMLRALESCEEELFSLMPSNSAISRWEYSSIQ